MTKSDLVADIAQKTGIEKMAIMAVVEEFMAVVKSTLAQGENVYLRGFGTFEVIERKEKTGRNITKGESIVIPAHNIPKFKPSQEFKDALR